MKVFIKNKLVSWGGGSDVTDISGSPVYKVKGRVLSIGRRKIMCDLEGNTLFVIRNRWFNPIRHKTYIKDAEGNRVATVYSKAFDLTRLYADTEKGQYTIQGKFFALSSTILRDGVPVAILERQFTVVADAFSLEASPEDMPFMTALVIALDNLCDNRSK